MTYPVLAELKAWVGETGSGNDANLTIVLNASIKFVEDFTGRVFVGATDTVAFPADRPYLVPGRSQSLFLHRDLVSITSVTNGDGTLLDSADYYGYSASLLGPFYEIRLYPASGVAFHSDGTQNIEVTGKWGYSLSCPDDVFLAILEYGKFRWQARSSGQAGAIAAVSRRSGLVVGQAEIPADILDVLRKYRR